MHSGFQRYGDLGPRQDQAPRSTTLPQLLSLTAFHKKTFRKFEIEKTEKHKTAFARWKDMCDFTEQNLPTL